MNIDTQQAGGGGTTTINSRKREREIEEDDGEEKRHCSRSDQQPSDIAAKASEEAEGFDSVADKAGTNTSNDIFEICSPRHQPEEASVSSIEDVLAVPLEIIFRRDVSQGTGSPQANHNSSSSSMNKKPLMSRAEAQCLLNVNLLAHEMDSIISSTEQLFDRRRRYSEFQLQQFLNPGMVPLVPLLHTLGNYVPEQSLTKLQQELDNVIGELHIASSALKQFSEQNWSLSESLLDMMAVASDNGSPNNSVAIEKRRLSDIQDEVCNRIESIIGKDSSSRDNNGVVVITMKEYCDRVMNQTPPSSPPASASQQTHSTSEPSNSQQQKPPPPPSPPKQQQHASHTKNNNKEGGEESQKSLLEEKENDPSSQKQLQEEQPQRNSATVIIDNNSASGALSSLAAAVTAATTAAADGDDDGDDETVDPTAANDSQKSCHAEAAAAADASSSTPGGATTQNIAHVLSSLRG